MIFRHKYLTLSCFMVGLSCSISSAQTFKMGIKTGLPQPSAFKVDLGSILSYTNSNYTVGPQLEIRVLGSLAVELDALYTSLPYSTNDSIQPAQKSSAHNWEFPVVIK